MLKNGFFIVALLLLISGCSETKEASKSQESTLKQVYTVNYPLFYFTQRMAPESVKVVLPVPKDIDPAFWQPNTEEMLQFIKADLIILNGANYSKWVAKASLPPSKMIDTSKAFAGSFIQAGGGDHTHGPAGKHAHSGTAFTTWLDMQQALQQAEAIKVALIALEPAKREEIEAGYATLETELTALDEAFKKAVTGVQRPLIASHPIYQYFARRYGLAIEALLWEPEMTIDAKAQREIRTLLAKHPAQVMIWEGKPTEENALLIESMGFKNIVIEPCMNRPDSGDFMSVMQTNAKALKEGY